MSERWRPYGTRFSLLGEPGTHVPGFLMPPLRGWSTAAGEGARRNYQTKPTVSEVEEVPALTQKAPAQSPP